MIPVSHGNTLAQSCGYLACIIVGSAIAVGFSSLCLFLGLLTGADVLHLECLVLLLFGGLALARSDWNSHLFFNDGGDLRPHRLLIVIFGLLLIADVTVFTVATQEAPYGQWDAWAIWNLKAKFLYRSNGNSWRDGFSSLIEWTHPDYPLLLPGFIARAWIVFGRETTAVPIALSAFFTFGSVVLLSASLTLLGGLRQGLLAGICLAATPTFFMQGASQYADVPMAFFLLATLTCIAIAERLNSNMFAVAAGIASGMAGWTKNEGLTWCCVFLAALIVAGRGRRLVPFLSGSGPVLAVILLFKFCVAPPGDIFGATGTAEAVDRLRDIGRYNLIGRAIVLHILSFGPLLISPFLILAGFLGITGMSTSRAPIAIRIGCIALTLLAFSYLFVYVIHPRDIAWLLMTTLDRLFVQLWPGIVFLVFLAARGTGSGSRWAVAERDS